MKHPFHRYTESPSHNSSRIVLISVELGIAATGPLPGQAAGGVAPSPAKTPAPTDVTVLSPFEVNVNEDTGYQAQSTLSGSRLNTRLKDTASPISVFTDEFLKDVGLTLFLELAEWAVGAEEYHNEDDPNQNNLQFSTGRINVRGLPAATGRNFHQWEFSIDTYNAERVEMASGSNAILFGLGSPGGMVNATTKRAQPTRDFLTIENRVGTYHLLRNTIDANKTLIPGKLALRVNLLKQESESWRHWEWNDSERAHAASTSRRPICG